jgi:hypothetical protein
MRDKDSATHLASIALGAQWKWRRFLDWARRGWHDSVYLHARLIDLQRPWEQQGPLRWRPEIGGPRLIGSRLPLVDGGEGPEGDEGRRCVPPWAG